MGTNICGDSREDSGSVSARVWFQTPSDIMQDSSVVYIIFKDLIVLGQRNIATVELVERKRVVE